jgi:hypothetical protein
MHATWRHVASTVVTAMVHQREAAVQIIIAGTTAATTTTKIPLPLLRGIAAVVVPTIGLVTRFVSFFVFFHS